MMKESDMATSLLEFDLLSEKEQALITNAYRSLSCSDNEVLQYFKQLYPSERDIHWAICYNEQLVWTLNPTFTIEQQEQFRQLIGTFLGVVNGFHNECPVNYALIDAYRKLELRWRMLKNGLTYSECVKLMPSMMREIVDDYYAHQMLDGKGAWIRNFIKRNLPTAEDMAAYINRPVEDFMETALVSRIGKTVIAVHELTKSLKRFIDQMMMLSKEELHAYYINRFYPFLGVRKGKFVRDYQMNHRKLPMLFLLKEKLCNSEDLYDKAYVLFNGIDGGAQHSRSTIAEQFHLTYARIQQLIYEGPKIVSDPLLQDPAWKSYQYLNQLPFMLPETPDVVELIKDEKLGIDFAGFAHMLALLGKFRVACFGEQTVLMNKESLPSLDLTLCWKLLQRDLQKRYKTESFAPMDNYIGSVSEEERPLAYALLYKLLPGVKGASAVEGYKVRFDINQTELDKAFIEILAQNGAPMGLKELHAAYAARFPLCPVSAWQVKLALKNSSQISYLRNRNSYGLTCWDHIFFGTIRDLLRTIITKSRKPVHIDKIMEQVLVYFPNATKRSVVNSMHSAPHKRFVETVGKDGTKGYWSWK